MSLKSPGILLKGLLLKVAILAKKKLKKSQKFKKISKNIDNPRIPNEFKKKKKKQEKTEQIPQKKQTKSKIFKKQTKKLNEQIEKMQQTIKIKIQTKIRNFQKKQIKKNQKINKIKTKNYFLFKKKNCCRGLATSALSSWGKPKFGSSWSFFSVLVGLAPVAPLPPDGFVLVRWEGGLCGGFCAGLAAVLRRGVLAGRQGHSIFLSEISIVRYHYKMYTRGFSCKDTFSFSLRSPSLSISLSSLDPCILY